MSNSKITEKPILELHNINKSFGDARILNDVSLTVARGDIYGVLGLSGAGKSTLVRCINGLETIDEGSITYYPNEDEGIIIADKNTKVARKYRREISMIFQHFNLLDQRSVLKNVELVGEINKDPERKEKALKCLELVGLSDKIKQFPSTLSGGQKQRVAIARALMSDPKILLCDEATSALDPETTASILELLKQLNKTLGLTIIIIAHQMTVIESICNKVAIIDKSRIVENGSLSDVFLNPQSDIAKRLVYANHVNTELDEKGLIRLKFNGNIDSPVVANIIQDCNILVSIVHADFRVTDGRIYGQTLIRLPYHDEDIAKLKKYLKLKKIDFEEVR